MMNVVIDGREYTVENTAALRELCERLRGAEYRKIYNMIPRGEENAITLVELADKCNVTIQMIMAFVNWKGAFVNTNFNLEIPTVARHQDYRVEHGYKVRRFAEIDGAGRIIPGTVHECYYRDRYAKIWIAD